MMRLAHDRIGLCTIKRVTDIGSFISSCEENMNDSAYESTNHTWEIRTIQKPNQRTTKNVPKKIANGHHTLM